MTRPSHHIRRVRTKHGPRAKEVNCHIRRRRPHRTYAASIVRRLERDNEALGRRQFGLDDFMYAGPVKLDDHHNTIANLRRTMTDNKARIRWLKGEYEL